MKIFVTKEEASKETGATIGQISAWISKRKIPIKKQKMIVERIIKLVNINSVKKLKEIRDEQKRIAAINEENRKVTSIARYYKILLNLTKEQSENLVREKRQSGMTFRDLRIDINKIEDEKEVFVGFRFKLYQKELPKLKLLEDVIKEHWDEKGNLRKENIK